MVRAKSTRPAPVKKKAVAKPVRRTTQRKAKKKPQREMPSCFGMSLRGLCFFIPCRFLLFLYPSLLLPLEALLWL